MKKIVLIVLCLSLIAGGTYSRGEKAVEGKYAIVMHTGYCLADPDIDYRRPPECLPRMVDAMLYALELKESGYEVVLIFDGAGTVWASELPRTKLTGLKQHYAHFKKSGIPVEICDYCAAHFMDENVKQSLPQSQLNRDYDSPPINGSPQRHLSLVKWIKKGYQIIVM